MLGVLITLGTFVMKPLDYGFDYSLVEESTTEQIEHVWYSSDDYRQAIVQRAYEIWGMDFVIMLECESWFNPYARWDSGRAYGLCQMNTRWHKLPQEYHDSWEYQVEYCYQKWIGGTKFYWPNRKINNQTCKNYVLDRFIIE